MESYFYETIFGKLHYKSLEEFDEKTVILFLHGASKTSQHTGFWQSILDIIQKYCSPILLDRFGHGKSQLNSKYSNISHEEHVEAIIGLINHIIDQQETNTIALIGRSAGGAYAMEISSQINDRIAALGLIAPAGGQKQLQFIRNWKKPLNLLWDVNDPVISFSNYEIYKVNSLNNRLFIVGETTESTVTSIDRGDSKPSHAPELVVPALFEEFLSDLCRQIKP